MSKGSGDRIFRAIAYSAAALILLIAVVFVIALFIPALPAITKFGLGFFVSRTWDPVRIQFGALPAIYGTLVTSAIGLLIAFPIGLGAALFLAEDAHRIARRHSQCRHRPVGVLRPDTLDA